MSDWSKKKMLIALGVGLLAAVIGIYMYNRWSKKSSGAQAATQPKTEEPKPTPSDKPATGTIYELSAEDIPNILAKEKNVLIMVYSPSCGHCHRMAPELEKASSM